MGPKPIICRKLWGVSANHVKDKDLIREIEQKTGWPAPAKKDQAGRRRYFLRFISEYLHGSKSVKAKIDTAHGTCVQVYSSSVASIGKTKFYQSDEWRALRYEALKIHGAKCQCCGATPKSSGRPMHVDHVKPRSKFPELALSLDNLQVLCEDCNLGKSNKDSTDWRDSEAA